MLSSLLTRLTKRLFDPGKKADYALAFALAAAPAIYAKFAGVANDAVSDGVTYIGYWNRYNFLSFLLLLPLALFLMRRGIGKIAPVLESWPPQKMPPVVSLVSEQGRRSAYEDLQRAILDPWLIGAALLTDLAIHVGDVGGFTLFYLRALGGASHEALLRDLPPSWRDWSVMFLISGRSDHPVPSSALANLPVVMLVYAAQFAIVLIGVLFFYAAFRHNYFFLQRVFQRRWSAFGQTREASIVINLDDADKCFGFRAANEAFNAQVWSLALCGGVMLFSRFAHVGGKDLHAIADLNFNELFPNLGQSMLAAGWLLALAVVSMPAIVKLLPQVGFLRGPALPKTTVASYFREFLPDDLCPIGAEPAPEEIDYFCSKFASNAFWPTGNNRARILFFLSFLVLAILLFPVVRVELAPSFFGYLALFALVAFALTWVGLRILELLLVAIDDRLAHAPKTPIAKPQSLIAAEAAAREKTEEIAELELAFLRLEEAPPNTYRLDLKSSPARSNATNRADGKITVDAKDLNTILGADAYGRKLGQALFADDAIRDAWVRANAAAETEGAKVRVRLTVDDDAVALHAIRWETLRDASGFEPFRGADRWFSRYVDSNDLQKAAQPRPRKMLKALVVIASPSELNARDIDGMQAIPVQKEREAAEKFLEDIASEPPTVLASGGQATLPRIIGELKNGVDIVYMICHGTLKQGMPSLVLEKDSGSVEMVNALDLVRALQDLDQPPGLMVLASCQSAGTGASEDALTALGPRLSAAGVPAVIAMQGKVDIKTVEAFMPVFFAELKQHGQIDRAVAVARGEVARKHSDYWMPVLFMRLRNGMLWQ